MLAAMTATRSTREWIAALEQVGVPCGPINNVAEVFADPQVVARGLRVDVPSPAGHVVPGIASPLRLSAAPPQYRLPPPALGAHTRTVLSGVLGMDAAQIDELARAGVINGSVSGA